MTDTFTSFITPRKPAQESADYTATPIDNHTYYSRTDEHFTDPCSAAKETQEPPGFVTISDEEIQTTPSEQPHLLS